MICKICFTVRRQGLGNSSKAEPARRVGVHSEKTGKGLLFSVVYCHEVIAHEHAFRGVISTI